MIMMMMTVIVGQLKTVLFYVAVEDLVTAITVELQVTTPIAVLELHLKFQQ
jgi:hypothetical protein